MSFANTVSCPVITPRPATTTTGSQLRATVAGAGAGAGDSNPAIRGSRRRIPTNNLNPKAVPSNHSTSAEEKQGEEDEEHAKRSQREKDQQYDRAHKRTLAYMARYCLPLEFGILGVLSCPVLPPPPTLLRIRCRFRYLFGSFGRCGVDHL